MYVLTMILQEEGLTLMDVISDIPHDAPAILVYILLAVCAYGLWWGNRNSGKKDLAGPQVAGGSGDRPGSSGTAGSDPPNDAAEDDSLRDHPWKRSG